jgi:hypothetical protein
MKASGNPFNNNIWMVWRLQTNGTATAYPFPLENHTCDGIVGYETGSVKIMLTAYSGASRLYNFSDGIFREILTFPERVRMQCYTSPSDGWGLTSYSRIYHWAGGVLMPSVTLDGDLSDLDMVSATEGWAGGHKTKNGIRTPTLWHYFDYEDITPTSLGRVKAVFK